MKCIFICFIPVFLMACHTPDKNETDTTIIKLLPEIKLSPLQQAVHDSLVLIVTKDLEHTGNIVKAVQVSGMEIIRISQKDYYIKEETEQETEFKNYLEHMRKFAKTNAPINNLQQLQENKAKHHAVMEYLSHAIKTASAQPQDYEVVYYLRADAGRIFYNQQQTTFLDKSLRKIDADYSFLK